MTPILPVILAGGPGTRLWPLSRALHPKPFLALTGGRSLLQETLLRLAPLDGALDPCIVCNEENRFLAAEQCREIGRSWSAILLEEVPRGTAPAAALAACRALAAGEDPALLVLPSDSHFEDAGRFREAVSAGLGAAAGGRLVTFGVPPSAPETGYGYIRAGEALEGGARRVAEFVEKPDRAAAERYVASGAFLWNSGVFLFRASAFARALSRHAPAVLARCREAIETGAADLDFFRPGPAFARAPAASIDRAIMERTDAAAVVPLETGWSDLGSWPALHAAAAADVAGNVLAGDVVAVETAGSLVRAESRLVATVGVDRLIVVETADAVLVAAWDAAQRVSEVVARLEALSRPEHRVHRRVWRPWGSFETVEAGDGYRVKRLTIEPGARLSLQAHRHRSEHWVVVRGTARVTRGDATLTLSENQSTYIPRGSRHRLGNPGETPLEVIEVQVGDYLGEDDIERFEDDFGRSREDRPRDVPESPRPPISGPCRGRSSRSS